MLTFPPSKKASTFLTCAHLNMWNISSQRVRGGLRYSYVKSKIAAEASKNGTTFSITYARIPKRSRLCARSSDVASLSLKRAILTSICGFIATNATWSVRIVSFFSHGPSLCCISKCIMVPENSVELRWKFKAHVQAKMRVSTLRDLKTLLASGKKTLHLLNWKIMNPSMKAQILRILRCLN